MNRRRMLVLLATGVLAVSGSSAAAAEIRLRHEYHCNGTLVMLSDIAEIRGDDADHLAALSRMELFPTPARQRTVRRAEVQELLYLHGIELADCRFGGASEVEVYPLSKQSLSNGQPVRVPRLESKTPAPDESLSQSPNMAVAVVVPLRRGDVIQADHVQMLPLPDGPNPRDLLFRIEDAIGKQAARNIDAGQLLRDQAVQDRILVRRGEVVSVVALASGVRVRSTAVSLDEGSRGDLVTVQTSDRKHKYTARVAGFQQVEVYAGGPQVNQ